MKAIQGDIGNLVRNHHCRFFFNLGVQQSRVVLLSQRLPHLQTDTAPPIPPQQQQQPAAAAPAAFPAGFNLAAPQQPLSAADLDSLSAAVQQRMAAAANKMRELHAASAANSVAIHDAVLHNQMIMQLRAQKVLDILRAGSTAGAAAAQQSMQQLATGAAGTSSAPPQQQQTRLPFNANAGECE